MLVDRAPEIMKHAVDADEDLVQMPDVARLGPAIAEPLGELDVLMRHQTMLTNALRAHLAEFGIIEPCGRDGLGRLIEAVQAGAGLPEVAGEGLLSLVRQIASLARRSTRLIGRCGWRRGRTK